jgi:hypothetical protein
LDAICRSLQESVARHGAQFDDQSLLLIRQLYSTEPINSRMVARRK